jgi:hypothetical protein
MPRGECGREGVDEIRAYERAANAEGAHLSPTTYRLHLPTNTFERGRFLERLAALVPPPRMQLKTYHGVLAPSASWRDEVVPKGPWPSSRRRDAADPEQEHSPRPPHRYLLSSSCAASSIWTSCAAGSVAPIADGSR